MVQSEVVIDKLNTFIDMLLKQCVIIICKRAFKILTCIENYLSIILSVIKKHYLEKNHTVF